MNNEYLLMGMADRNFIMNSGSFFIVGVLIVINYVGMTILNSYGKYMAKNRTIRSICIKLDSTNRPLRGPLKMLFLESYFDLGMCSIMGMSSFWFWTDHSFAEYWISPEDILCSSLTFLFTGMFVGFPIYAYRGIKDNFKELSAPIVRKRYEYLYENNKVGTIHQALYNVYFIVRRFLVCIILVCL